MSYQVLARKWRPRDFQQVVGQAHVVQALVNALDTQRLHHAFLFTGTRGVGKTTIARILAKCLNCEQGERSKPCGACSACLELDQGRFVDLIEVDAASRAKVDETRELMDNVPYAPARGRYKVYLIDEVHMFSTHSFNALLKTLEEPPPHVKFLLATTDPQKLPVTVLSRCLQFNLKRLPAGQIAEHMEHILAEEQVGFESPGVRLIAKAADGSLRDALSLLDQAIAYGAGEISAADVKTMLGTLDGDRISALLEALAEGDALRLMRCVAEMAEQASDFSSALAQIQSTLQRLALLQMVPDAVDDEEGEVLRELAGKFSAEDVQLFYQIALMGAHDLPLAPDPQGGFEMIMLRMLAFRPVSDERPLDELKAAPTSRAPDDGKGGPPRASEPAPPPPPTGGGPEGPGPQTVSPETWSSVVEGLGVSGLARELAANSLLVRCEGNVIELKVSDGHAHLNTPSLKEQLSAALAAYSAKPVRLLVRLGETPRETPAQKDIKAVEARRQEAVRAFEGDPNVHEICDAFDAVIDKDSIQPVDS